MFLTFPLETLQVDETKDQVTLFTLPVNQEIEFSIVLIDLDERMLISHSK